MRVEYDLSMHEPRVFTDGGPWATHDHACCVCQVNKSVLELHTGVFMPCWSCQVKGWELDVRDSVWGRLRRRWAERSFRRIERRRKAREAEGVCV